MLGVLVSFDSVVVVAVLSKKDKDEHEDPFKKLTDESKVGPFYFKELSLAYSY
jgi:hypothetical protein